MDSTPGNFHVSPVKLDEALEWNTVFETYWESWKDPLQVTGLLTFPWLGEGSTQEEASYKAAKSAYHELALQHPDQVWLKVEDCGTTGSPRIVGGGVFTIVRDATFEDSQTSSGGQGDIPDIKLPGLGYPLGSERNVLMRQLYSQMHSWRPKLMANRPHMYGQALWVLPAYRQLGAAAALMDGWLERADALSLEAFLEGSAIATPLYLQKGFVLLERPVMVFRHPVSDSDDKGQSAPSEEWARLVKGLHAEPIAIMWRPVRGDYKEGQTVLPWIGQPRRARL